MYIIDYPSEVMRQKMLNGIGKAEKNSSDDSNKRF